TFCNPYGWNPGRSTRRKMYRDISARSAGVRRSSERIARVSDSGRASEMGNLRATGGLVRQERSWLRGALPVRATSLEMLAGVGLDLFIGDPRWLPHPVRAFGWYAMRLERFCRATRLGARAAGVVFWLCAISLAAGVVAASIVWLPRPWVHIYWIFT